MPRPTRLLLALRRRLAGLGDPERARGARAYVKSEMPFHGVGAVPLRAACRELFAPLARLRRAAPRRDLAFLPVCEELVSEGAWWDVVDAVAAHLLGELLRKEPRAMRRELLAWARCDDLWKRRSAILCQLGAGEGTDFGLLRACIEPSLGSEEFFLRKAIGWALRQHARTNPGTVRRYVEENARRLSGLSRREATKRLGDATAPGRKR